MLEILLAAVEGKIQVAAAALGVPIGIGLIGFKACESVGRNPDAATAILVQSIICMAFAEAIIFFAIFLG
ncbi:MAG: ATPase [Puniceicoccaceae bacterium TMED149]|nr:MAG: ATPase [Puniceicoccaceae bacterium TMED149]